MAKIQEKSTPRKGIVPSGASNSFSGRKIAVVLVRGMVDVSSDITDSLLIMRLLRKNHCVILTDSAVNRGMLQKVKDYVTWGEITDETFKELVAKRGLPFQGSMTDRHKKYTYKTLVVDNKHYKPYFRLNPPLKGFGRKGVKAPFKLGGALGNRAEKMNDLIMRML